MQLTEVTDEHLAKRFLQVNVIINRNDPNYIRPLDKDESRVGEALRLALLLSAVVSGLLLGGGMLAVTAGRKRISGESQL